MRDLITAYTFNAGAGTITLTGINPIVPSKVLGIWNGTDGVKLYDPHVPSYGATFATNVITLTDVDTSGMANGDALLIFYEGAQSDALASQATLAAVLAKIIAAPSTEAKQDAANTLLTTLAGKDFATQTTLAAILAKIIAAPSTEAKQDTGNTALADVNTNVGGTDEIVASSDTATSGLNGLLKRALQHLTSLLARFPAALGAGGGLKVDGSGTALPVSGTVAVTGVATSANQATEQGLIGALTETAPGTDTASSGLNGRLQRIAQRLTSLIALVPAALTGSGNFKVAVQEALPAGTNNIGDVDVLSLPAIPSGTNTIGKTSIAFQTTKALTNASVSASSSGENTLVSGTASQTIRVFKLVLVAAAPVGVSFKDAAGGTSLTGVMPLSTGGTMVLESNDGEPLFVSATAGAFILNLSAAIAVTGFIQYTKS